jgi:hypothetical protein
MEVYKEGPTNKNEISRLFQVLQGTQHMAFILSSLNRLLTLLTKNHLRSKSSQEEPPIQSVHRYETQIGCLLFYFLYHNPCFMMVVKQDIDFLKVTEKYLHIRMVLMADRLRNGEGVDYDEMAVMLHIFFSLSSIKYFSELDGNDSGCKYVSILTTFAQKGFFPYISSGCLFNILVYV